MLRNLGTPIRFRSAPAVLMLAAAAGLLSSCAQSNSGGTKESDKEPPPAEKGPLEAYAALKEEVMRGNFIALFDCASSGYRAASFPAEKYKPILASDPKIRSLGITAADVARMSAREAVDAYFKLLPLEVKGRLAVALSDTRVTGKTDLPDGRVAIEIESGGVKSKIFWKKEAGAWRMDGEEKGQDPQEERRQDGGG